MVLSITNSSMLLLRYSCYIFLSCINIELKTNIYYLIASIKIIRCFCTNFLLYGKLKDSLTGPFIQHVYNYVIYRIFYNFIA